jgi:tetratricopeptide (TPR) repeat protein
MMALFNRALLLDKTGNLRGAIRDYSKVINEYPNFWFGLQQRAQCYRKLGNKKQAELDEFRIFKAQMDKRAGKQPRLNKRQLRKRHDDEDMDKYNQLVVADEENREPEYKNAYRGRVQNHNFDVAYQPMYYLTTEDVRMDVRKYVAFDREVEQFNIANKDMKHIYVNSLSPQLDEDLTSLYFARIDTLNAAIQRAKTMAETKPLLIHRAIAYSVIQNFTSAIDDLTTLVLEDSTQMLAYWQRAVCQQKLNDFNASQGTNIEMQKANVLSDLSRAISLSQSNPYLYYNRGNVYADRKDYAHALDDYCRALELDRNLAEAYYNRGLVYIYKGDIDAGISDLSKAGEQGLYTAYSVIKKYRKK